MFFLLWLFAVLLVVGGILAVVRHEVILGVILILLAVLVGPGGVSLLS
ncbi:MAG TPA: GPGG-motif small membrane protein [Actinomycetota bacterium]|nr:GPGG-motif small membrane protein [Actinomycetota bacterium]HNO16148.1 GPGG-motif small membrane protein [Actinomycetota bacterium]HUM87634.1 GPGG-motif small membrane protein [Actinomycetota bacterium]